MDSKTGVTSAVSSALRDIATKYNLLQCVDLADALDKAGDPIEASAIEANLAIVEAQKEFAVTERARAASIAASSVTDSALAAHRLRSLEQNERQCLAMESIARSLTSLARKYGPL